MVTSSGKLQLRSPPSIHFSFIKKIIKKKSYGNQKKEPQIPQSQYCDLKSRRRIIIHLYLLLLSILLFKGLPLFEFLIYLVQKCPTPLYLSRDKIKGQSGKNATLIPTKILPKKQDCSPVIFKIALSTYKLYSFFKKKKNTYKLDSQNKNT